MIKLNEEQEAAILRLKDFLSPKNPSRTFMLGGYAGTGKTTTISQLLNDMKGEMVFTAPTNKATKVLKSTLYNNKENLSYLPDCRTIYSLLRLRMEANGEVKELTRPENPVELDSLLAIVVDESSMLGPVLRPYLQEAAEQTKIIFMGDPCQLPPVDKNEDSGLSFVWSEVDESCYLNKVMRHDNQILSVASSLREQVSAPYKPFSLQSNFDLEGGVYRDSRQDFLRRMQDFAKSGTFSEVDGIKVIAWRNATVDTYNNLIRQCIYKGAEPFLPGDRIILTEPAKDFIDEVFIASTDDEGTIEKSSVEPHFEYREFLCHRIVVQIDSGSPITLWKLHASAESLYKQKVMQLAKEAKEQKYKWRAYWKFREAFHNFRYSYAITAHRAQGSTYTIAMVDAWDILMNRNRAEAFRCLYVACTRVKKSLYVYL